MRPSLPVAVLLCGPSLSGKTTLARGLAPLLGAQVISADAINDERGIPFGAEGLPESTWARTLELELDRIALAGRRRCNVIVDDTCCYRWLRDRLRSACESAGLQPLLLVLRPGDDQILERHALVLRDGARPVLAAARLADHLARFEWPAEDERFVDVTWLGIAQVVDSLAGLYRGRGPGATQGMGPAAAPRGPR